MSTRDKRVDAYIAKSADFAKPILTHLRAMVHQGCPEVEETLKWGMPTFLYKGKILCGIAAFKAHCTFGFWQGALIVAGDKTRTAEAMGQFGRLSSVKELPGKRLLLGYIKAAMKLRDDGVKTPRTRKPGRKPPAVPADLAAGLKKSARARAAWAKFSPSARREYIDWITEAKRPETRAERLATTLKWVAEGKQRNWKYM
jgi:uncharacterized protein YdeI (YjbR/CyaY-like superfamily)